MERQQRLSQVAVFVAVALLAVVGCGDRGPPSPPDIVSFTATPASITDGDTSTLAWEVTGATDTSIDQGVGSVAAASGTIDVSPTTTTTYTLTAMNAGGNTTAETTVTVTPAPPTTGVWDSSTWDDAVWGP